jgi:hypothetical protein
MSVHKPALTIVQADNILETLSLLTAEQHKNSKLVTYDSMVVIESDASLNRTINAAASITWSSLRYIAGYSSTTGVRDLAELVPLMERVSNVYKQQQVVRQDSLSKCTERYALAQKADQGLTALTVNQYLSDSTKAALVENAQVHVRALMTYFQSLGGDQPLKSAEQQTRVQLVTLERENAALRQQVIDKQQTIDALKRQADEIPRLKAAIVQQALDAPLSETVVVERISQLAQMLAQMQLKK